ncbi:hypothetical protein WSS15_28770 [Acetobacter pasteurianus]|uniref:Uncharacterized protein n=1 Tax=Acetobacter pasteurianus NBRC 3278 TaxID=1226660 RepID=A0A401X6E7_ACEPA|nr:hypothetical protein [Acetobacter pasteurianus]GCD59802.1 hypothetical protein NBRC3277_2377 [Acetobacter pasteurianus NBRC 3277]GCD63313.1 hypothetical protein NBRC3278_2406 [Acetobacter pasteurianus NBRC 3278]GCD69683.1 hypothetical protein NBRC3280_2318 [Acetobacter pasteurianus NBRC 3280]GLH30227.1 hypothetical protein WSS15_28770 [Acetobacter pasteurianus]
MIKVFSKFVSWQNLLINAACTSIGFLLACIFFVYSENNADKWGDFATWFSGFAALFAFLVAAKANKQNADQFSRSLTTQIVSSYVTIIQEKAQIVNESVQKLSRSGSKYKASQMCFDLSNNFLDCVTIIKTAADGNVYVEKKLMIIFLHLLDKRFFGEIKNHDISKAKFRTDSPIPWMREGESDSLLGVDGNFRKSYREIEEILVENEDCI